MIAIHIYSHSQFYIMKKINKRYKDHDICSLVGARTIISQLNNYVTETINHLKTIQTECENENLIRKIYNSRLFLFEIHL